MEVCFFFCFFSEMFSVVTNQMSVNTVCLANASVFSRPGLCVPVFACKRRVVLSVLTALQVNKPQLPVSVLIFPRDFDGQGAETVVGDGAGACLGSYLLCIGRHHFQHPVSLPPPPPPFTLLSLSWTRTVGPPDAARTRWCSLKHQHCEWKTSTKTIKHIDSWSHAALRAKLSRRLLYAKTSVHSTRMYSFKADGSQTEVELVQNAMFYILPLS